MRAGGRRGTRGAAALAACAVLLAAACGRSGTPSGATVPTDAPATTTTTIAAEVDYSIPVTIDQAYVQRVVSAFDAVLGDAIRILERDGKITDEFLEHLLAIYTEPEFEVQERAWTEAVRRGRLDNTPSEPGDPTTSVMTIVQATRTCVIARAERDLTSTLLGVPEESPQDDYVVLVAKRDRRDPRRVNLTPWVMSFDGFRTDNAVPERSCEG